MFKIKICGITESDDAVKAVEFGADAIGLNFYEKSRRFVSDEQATKILNAAGDGVARVGVFVNAAADEIERRMALSLTHVQLHGDEDPELVGRLQAWPVIRAIRLAAERDDEQAIDVANAEIKRWTDAGVQAVLLDAAAPGQYGGTGTKLSWSLVSQLECSVPVILAGGLTAENVSQAIREASPHTVDVASCVESAAGKKDDQQMRSFIERAKEAFG